MELIGQKENINCIFQVKIITSLLSAALQKLRVCYVNFGETLVRDLKLKHNLVNMALNNLIFVLI